MSELMKEHERNIANNAFEKKLNLDGSENPKYVDLLEEDRPISGQKFCCISFISPEKIIKERQQYFFEQYVKQWDMAKSLDKFNQFMHFLSVKYSLRFDNLSTDLQEFCKEEKGKLFLTNMTDEFKSFLDKNEEQLEEEFNKNHNFQTSVRGIKVRGCYPSQGEAEMRCKLLREGDPNHDVFVGPVGTWMPFHPEAYKTGRVEYMEEALNELMNEKGKNEQSAKSEFEKYVRDNKEQAIANNKKKASENNTTVSEVIEGTATTEAPLSEVQKELFEGENVVIKSIDPVNDAN
jgi:hypothetical protein